MLGRELPRHLVDIGRAELRASPQEAQQQQAVADRVDAPGDAAADAVDGLAGRGIEERLAAGAGALQAVLDVALGLVGVQRPDAGNARGGATQRLGLVGR